MRRYAGARAHQRVPMDDAAKRRLIAAYTSDECPSTEMLARRFGRSSEVIAAVLDEAGIARRAAVKI